MKKDVIAESNNQGAGNGDLKANLQQIERMVMQQVKSGGLDNDQLQLQKHIQPIHYAHIVFVKLMHL